MSRRGLATTVLAAAALAAAALATGVTAAGGAATEAAQAIAPACASYPRPGTRVAGPAPSRLREQYGVLRRDPRPRDRIALSRLGQLPESQILTGSVRFLGGVAEGGRVYLVAARHLLPDPLAPVRCLPASQRALQRALLPGLRREYAHRALCLVIVYRARAAPTCQPAPATVAPLLIAAGTPALGLVPDGVAAVRLSLRSRARVSVAVHGNFWRAPGTGATVAPCGLGWIDRDGVVLRTVTSCTGTRDTT